MIGKWLDIQLDIGKIDRMHHLKVKGSQGMPCQITVKFCNYHDQEGMYRAKGKLKSSKIAITEHLTGRRYKLFKLAKEAFGVRNVWTLGGKIFTLYNVCSVHRGGGGFSTSGGLQYIGGGCSVDWGTP